MSRHPWLLLASLMAGLGLVVTVWTSIDRRPPEWDYANHLERALHCYQILAQPGHDRLREILEATAFYPPVAPCTAGLLYFFSPVSPLTAQVVMWGFLVLGAVSVFLLGRYLLDTSAGLLAAFFLSTAPFVVSSLTNFQLDLPLTGMAAQALKGGTRHCSARIAFVAPGRVVVAKAKICLFGVRNPVDFAYLVMIHTDARD